MEDSDKEGDTGEQEEEEEDNGRNTQPSTINNNAPSTDGSNTQRNSGHRIVSLTEYNEMIKANKKLQQQLMDATGTSMINVSEVKLVQKYIKTDLFKKIKFITTINITQTAMDMTATHMGVTDVDKRDAWMRLYANTVKKAFVQR